jgi:hypothetical protein
MTEEEAVNNFLIVLIYFVLGQKDKRVKTKDSSITSNQVLFLDKADVIHYCHKMVVLKTFFSISKFQSFLYLSTQPKTVSGKKLILIL